MGRKILIENCEFTVEYECPFEWKNLKKTEDAKIRFCNECNKNVYRVKTDAEMEKHINLNHCIAVNGPDNPIGMMNLPDMGPIEDLPRNN